MRVLVWDQCNSTITLNGALLHCEQSPLLRVLGTHRNSLTVHCLVLAHRFVVCDEAAVDSTSDVDGLVAAKSRSPKATHRHRQMAIVARFARLSGRRTCL